MTQTMIMPDRYANTSLADIRISVKNGAQARDCPQVEAFTNEEDALDFVNRLSMRAAHEAW
jgi:hypothetical protein